MTGKKPRPRTEPMYSGGNIDDFPLSNGIEYIHFIASVQNSENFVINQSFHDGHFSGIFAPSKRYSPRPAVSWTRRHNYHSFLELVKENWKVKNGKSKHIFSLACDENLGFGVFSMENYGIALVTITTDAQNKFREGFHITACAARGSTFYVVMTKGTEEYKWQAQERFFNFTTSTWDRAKGEIMEKYREGKVITGICYSTRLRQYFVVMTTIPERKTWKWFDGIEAARKWMDSLWEYHPTVTFKDPIDRKTIVVMTTDENISSARCT